MKKVIMLLASTAFVLFLTKTSYAQQAPVPSTVLPERSQRWVCLDIKKCDKPESQCSGRIKDPTAGAQFGIDPYSHRVRLDSFSDPNFKSIPHEATYIFDCLSKDKDSPDVTCTSGNPQVDEYVFGQNNLALLASGNGYQFKEMVLQSTLKPPDNWLVRPDDNGNIPTVEYEAYSQYAYTRKFLALSYFVTAASPTSVPATFPDVGTPSAQTQQQGSFNLQEFSQVVSSNTSQCLYVRYDPFGRVFDSQTLEPIPGAQVVLYKKRDDGSFTFYNPSEDTANTFKNPQITDSDGVFNFVVGDGTYKLQVSAAGYSPASKDQINDKYSTIYDNLYPVLTGDEIVEKDGVQHRDIPLVADTPKTYTPHFIEQFRDVDKRTGILKITGRISHPFAKISAYSISYNPQGGQKTGAFISSTTADKEGSFTLEINQGSLTPDQVFGELRIDKVSVTSNQQAFKLPNLFHALMHFVLDGSIGKVMAQGNSLSLYVQPIPNNLQGYAYDVQGNVIPNAKVGVYLTFSKKPYYETVADNKGFYSINSDLLPTMPYKLIYTASNGITSEILPTDFIARNAGYLKNNKVNLYAYKDLNGHVLSTDTNTQKGNGNIQFGGAQTNGNDQSSTPHNNFSNTITVTMIILFITVLVVAGIIGFYMWKKRATSQ